MTNDEIKRCCFILELTHVGKMEHDVGKLGFFGVTFLLPIELVMVRGFNSLQIGLALAIVGGISNRLPFTPTGLLAAAGFAFLLLVSLQLSISLSGHQEAIRGIAETVAALEERVARAERESHRQPDQSSQS